MKLDDNITYLKGIGPKRAENFKKLGIYTAKDLLYHFPRRYADYTSPVLIKDVQFEENNVIKVKILRKNAPAFLKNKMVIYKAVACDESGEITIVIYNSEFAFRNLMVGEEYILSGKIVEGYSGVEISAPAVLKADSENKILPVYSLTEGITQQLIRTSVENALKILDKEIYEPVSKNYLLGKNLASLVFSLKNIHFPKDMESMRIAKERLVFDELLVLQLGMSMIKGKSNSQTGCKMNTVSLLPFEKSLPFEMTEAQKNAVSDCVKDMQKSLCMNRLVQGDVGSGKTVVACACAYFSAKNGFQTALMAPTEILATQHFETFNKLLKPMGISVALLVGSMSQKAKNEVKEKIAKGQFMVAVGTHALIQDSIEFKKLGLVITDEQHRFGVEQRALLSSKGDNPHKLVMSATPIPRTLALMIYGDLDISVINQMPKGRKPIKTYAVTGKMRQRAFGFVKRMLDEGRQGYIVCPMIEESDLDLQSVEKYCKDISKNEFRDYSVGLLHGKMTGEQKDKVMSDFKSGKLQLLVSTTVVEVGVDVPNACVMVIENADRFGLSQLHQLRGRVGRGDVQSHCILITDNLNDKVKQRMNILAKNNDGFKISEEDLKLRGPGDFFGQRQHGLPNLKIADMAENMESLNLAQQISKEILEKDSDLSHSENKNLKQLVEKLFDKKVDLN